MELTYIAAPYRAKAIITQQHNIQDASLMAQFYWLKGHAVICPHLNSRNFDGLVDDEWFLSGTLLMLSKCTNAIFHPDWLTSEGCRREMTFCEQHNIKITILTPGSFHEMKKIIKASWRPSND